MKISFFKSTLSDFFYGIYDAVRSVKAGMDMEMPYYFRYAVLNHKLKKGGNYVVRNYRFRMFSN